MISQQASMRVSKSKFTAGWLPIVFGVIQCIFAAIGYWTLEKQEDKSRRQSISAEARRISDIIDLDINNRMQSLQRLVNRWEIRGGTPRDEFLDDVRAYVADSPGYQALEWVDESFHVRWIVPLAGNEPAQDLDLAFETNRRNALEKARDRRTPTMTSPVDLVQGGKGFLIYLPIFIDETFNGFVLAVFRTQEWLGNVLQADRSEKTDDFHSLVAIDDDEVFTSTKWIELFESRWDTASDATIFEHRFHVTVRPTDSFIDRSRSYLPEIILIAGALLSLLVAIVIYLYQKTNAAIKQTRGSIESLETEAFNRNMAEKSLAVERGRLSTILEGTNAGTWEWNVQTGEMLFNERWAEIIGYTLEEISPVSIETWKKFTHPDDLVASNRSLERHFSGELDYHECEVRMLHKEWSWIWVLERGRVSSWTADGKPLLAAGTCQDITNRKQIEIDLRESEERFRSTLASMDDLVFVLDAEGIFVDFHQPHKKNATFVSPTLFLGKSHREILPPDVSDMLAYAIAEVKKSGNPHEVEYLLPEGDENRWFQARVSARTDINGGFAGVTAVARDVTERRKIEEKIRHMANHDTLTGLPSLNLAMDRMSVALAAAARNSTMGAVMFVDLDGFKQVNDTYGHDAGDALLKETATRFQSTLRKTDTVARIGGDEFVVIATEVHSLENVKMIADKTLTAALNSFDFNGNEIYVGASIGIALFPDHGDNAKELLKKADDAMYEIKRSGKKGIAFVRE